MSTVISSLLGWALSFTGDLGLVWSSMALTGRGTHPPKPCTLNLHSVPCWGGLHQHPAPPARPHCPVSSTSPLASKLSAARPGLCLVLWAVADGPDQPVVGLSDPCLSAPTACCALFLRSHLGLQMPPG